MVVKASLFHKLVMQEPKLSIIGSAVRVNRWLDMHAAISGDTSTPFEIVFVGSVKPDFDLPDNLRYIYSEVKPVQCMEIAARNARGKYLCDTADDLTFSNGFFDRLVAEMDGVKGQDLILVPMIARRVNKRIRIKGLTINKKDKHSPLVGMITFAKAETWHSLGGMDRNFITSWHNHDLKLRLMARGGKLIPVRNTIAVEGVDGDCVPVLRYMTGKQDKEYLLSCWYNGKRFSKTRLRDFEPFVDEDLLIVTQGKKDEQGKW